MRISDWSSDVCSSDLARRTTLGLIDVGLAAAAAFEARTLRIEHLAVVGHVVLGEAHEVALAQHLEVGADRVESQNLGVLHHAIGGGFHARHFALPRPPRLAAREPPPLPRARGSNEKTRE